MQSTYVVFEFMYKEIPTVGLANAGGLAELLTACNDLHLDVSQHSMLHGENLSAHALHTIHEIMVAQTLVAQQA